MTDEIAAPEKLIELPERTREFLAGLRPDEIDTLTMLVELPADDVREGFQLVRDIRTVTRALRWVILTVLAVLVGGVALYENFVKFIGYWKGAKL